MTRSRSSAKAAGTRFESPVANFLAFHLADDRIERRAKSGAKDRDDIGGVRAIRGGCPHSEAFCRRFLANP